jgi:hypothetical protein
MLVSALSPKAISAASSAGMAISWTNKNYDRVEPNVSGADAGVGFGPRASAEDLQEQPGHNK